MSRLPPGQAPARDRHGNATPELGFGWCLPCYDAGAFTLALTRDADLCAVHGRSDNHALRQRPAAPHTPRRRSRPPRGRAGREPRTDTGPPGTARSSRHTPDRSTARAMAYGRRRAAARVTARGYQPHPGWRNFIDSGWRVLVDQAEAMRTIEALVEAEDWRSDKRSSWLQILRQLVCCMDWTTGLVSAVTADKLGSAGGRAPRTVSRVIGWAREIGLIVVVEHAASAEFLGTSHGRTPTYALVSSTPSDRPQTGAGGAPGTSEFSLFSRVVDESGDPSASAISSKPLQGTRLTTAGDQSTTWPIYAIPTSTDQRRFATQTFLYRIGQDPNGTSAVPLWRTRALLHRWWTDGACVAGLLFALDHHPDRPEHGRGDALRGARDPLAVIGARLRPWGGRLAELPATLAGIQGDYRSGPARPTTSAKPHAAPGIRLDPPTRTLSTSAARQAARAALETHLRQLRADRR